MNEVAFSLVQTLRHRTLFEMPAGQPGTTIHELCLYHSRSTIDSIETMLQTWPFQAAHWRYLYVTMHPLILLLDNPRAPETFTKTCRIMRYGCEAFPICDYLLYATQAFAWAIGEALPKEAEQYLPERKTGGGVQGRMDNVSFALPRQDDIWDLMTAGGTLRKGSVDVEEDIGLLVQNWTLHDVMMN
jgi:hypothetical protein